MADLVGNAIYDTVKCNTAVLFIQIGIYFCETGEKTVVTFKIGNGPKYWICGDFRKKDLFV